MGNEAFLSKKVVSTRTRGGVICGVMHVSEKEGKSVFMGVTPYIFMQFLPDCVETERWGSTHISA